MLKICKICSKNFEKKVLILPCCGYGFCFDHFQPEFVCPICHKTLTETDFTSLLQNRIGINEHKLKLKLTESVNLINKIKFIISKPNDYVSTLVQVDQHRNALEWFLKELEIIDINEALEKSNQLYTDTQRLKATNIELIEYVKFLDRRLTIFDSINSYLDLEKRFLNSVNLKQNKWTRLKERRQFVPHLESIRFIESIHFRKILALVTTDCKIHLIETNTYAPLVVLEGHTDLILSLIYINDDCIVSSSKDKTIKLWDLKTYKCSSTLKGHEDHVTCLNKMKQNKIFYVISGSLDKTIRFWKKDTCECVMIIQETDSIELIECFPDSDIIIGFTNGKIRLRKKATDYKTWFDFFDLFRVDFIRRIRESLFVSVNKDGVIMLMEKSSGGLVNMYSCDESISSVGINNSEGLVIVGLSDGTIEVIDVKANQCLNKIKAHMNEINCLKVAYNGIITVSNEAIKFWE